MNRDKTKLILSKDLSMHRSKNRSFTFSPITYFPNKPNLLSKEIIKSKKPASLAGFFDFSRDDYFLVGFAGINFGLAAMCSTFFAGAVNFFTVALVLAILFIV